MKTITASRARSELFSLLKGTVKGHRQVRITSKEGNTILMSEEDYESLVETLELLSEPGLKESIRKAEKEIENGETISIEEAFPE
jgi:antitoxin YefM